MKQVWRCPCCDWLVADIEYGSIVFDPECQGCHAKKWSEFQFHEEWPAEPPKEA